MAGFPPRPFARRIDGQLLVASLRSPQLRAWWLARDAPARWLAANPTHCLAHWLDVSSEELEAAMADASLFGKGVRASARLERIGAHESAEFKAGDTRLNFVCMGHAHPQACALPLDNPPGNPRPAAYTPLLTTVAGCHACGPARAPACRVSVQP